MFEFIQLQYRMGRIDAQQVRAFAPQYITEEQAEEIVTSANHNA